MRLCGASMTIFERLENYIDFESASLRAKELAKEFNEITSVDRFEGGWSVLVSSAVVLAISNNAKILDSSDEYDDYSVADLAHDCGWDDVEAFEICQLGW